MAKKKTAKKPSTALTKRAPQTLNQSPFERMAADPKVDVEKLERLMQMHERTTARTAEQQFNAAMTAAQAEMTAIGKDAANEQTRSRYATYTKLDRVLRPIYIAHGFGLSFDTGESAVDYVRVLCYVTHTAGHARTYKIDMPADGKGAKGGDVMTKTHAVGSASAYGMRYLLKMIFNVAIGEDDDDGNKASAKRNAAPPVREGQVTEQPSQRQVDLTGATITLAQRDRLVKIVEKTGRAQAEVLLWLKATYKASGTKDIRQADYAAIKAALSGRGPLPMKGDGQ